MEWQWYIERPAGCKTFGDLADVLVKIVHSHINATCTRVDVVFDHYKEVSMKQDTRDNRAANNNQSIRRRINNRDVPLPH